MEWYLFEDVYVLIAESIGFGILFRLLPRFCGCIRLCLGEIVDVLCWILFLCGIGGCRGWRPLTSWVSTLLRRSMWFVTVSVWSTERYLWVGVCGRWKRMTMCNDIIECSVVSIREFQYHWIGRKWMMKLANLLSTSSSKMYVFANKLQTTKQDIVLDDEWVISRSMSFRINPYNQTIQP